MAFYYFDYQTAPKPRCKGRPQEKKDDGAGTARAAASRDFNIISHAQMDEMDSELFSNIPSSTASGKGYQGKSDRKPFKLKEDEVFGSSKKHAPASRPTTPPFAFTRARDMQQNTVYTDDFESVNRTNLRINAVKPHNKTKLQWPGKALPDQVPYPGYSETHR
eukprot:NODE_6471_length_844_cov_130.345354_g6235_i0.p1 GENE.NODE_6471_length_844_cov_130.345354_g6235_i0~~NODE_6471_length_844_cov_130.345354_g6235_i0.p1  ORF type:complete len:163 (+),score=34.88 NODE_6471_length_844_cov_130.345354_g6235_i0:63-551(+)